jgi:hypothetical protein
MAIDERILRAHLGRTNDVSHSAAKADENNVGSAAIYALGENQVVNYSLLNAMFHRRFVGSGWTGEILHGLSAQRHQELGDRVTRASSNLRILMSESYRSLLQHSAVVTWVKLTSLDTEFHSGTSPDIPGVIFLSKDLITVEAVTDALLHESCHSKFFDLCMGWDILGPIDSNFSIDIPWIEETSLRKRTWPIDQTLAAAHAYVHLAYLRCFEYPIAELAGDSLLSGWSHPVAKATFLLNALTGAGSSLALHGSWFVHWLRECLDLLVNGLLAFRAGFLDPASKYTLADGLQWSTAGDVCAIGNTASARVVWADAETCSILSRLVHQPGMAATGLVGAGSADEQMLALGLRLRRLAAAGLVVKLDGFGGGGD